MWGGIDGTPGDLVLPPAGPAGDIPIRLAPAACWLLLRRLQPHTQQMPRKTHMSVPSKIDHVTWPISMRRIHVPTIAMGPASAQDVHWTISQATPLHDFTHHGVRKPCSVVMAHEVPSCDPRLTFQATHGWPSSVQPGTWQRCPSPA